MPVGEPLPPTSQQGGRAESGMVPDAPLQAGPGTRQPVWSAVLTHEESLSEREGI